MLHLFSWSASTLAVPVSGNPLGNRYRHGTWRCTMCGILMAFAIAYDLDHADDCPGARDGEKIAAGNPVPFLSPDREGS
jgi:hypothetical protein